MKPLYIRKSIAVIMIAVLISIFTFSTISADTGIIYEKSTMETITSGATLQNLVRFTKDGWLNINVLRVDLSNPNIDIDSMSNSESITKLTTTRDLAASRGAVAAINGGYFSWGSKSGVGYPIGDSVESGKVTSSAPTLNQTKDAYTTLSISKLNELMYNYWKTEIHLYSSNGLYTPITRYNKLYSANNDFTILDKRWSSQTVGNVNGPSDIFEMIIENGVVTQFRQSQPATAMPVNGYEVVTRQDGAKILLSNFKIGDPVVLEIKTTPDWNNLKAAITGGSMLVKDGQIPQAYSMVPPDGSNAVRNPRTAVGSTADGKQLLLVTVDGRQAGSIGMTLKELGQFMLELGATNALNFDGGGSTTMVARTPNSQELEIVNNPSDSSGRKIATALGIFSIAPPSELDGLIINSDDSNVFVNTSRTFTIKGYDRYYNPIEVDPSKVIWSATGIKGTFKDSTFYPTSIGTGTITATYNNVSTTMEINSLSSPVQLFLNNSSINMPLNDTMGFSVCGKNKNGYYADIDQGDVKWTAKGENGTMDNGIFTSTAAGTGYIDAAVGDTHAYCTVSVETEKKTALDSFENAKASFVSYPSTVQGNFEISAEQQHSGKTSGKLTFKFSDTVGSRAAYILYPNGGLLIDTNTQKIGLWVYNDTPRPDWLAASVVDAKGGSHSLYFTKNIDWTGWQYVEASTAGITSPSTLAKIYIVQTNPVTDEGSIYVDDLEVKTSSFPKIDLTKIPKDTVPVDVDNKAVSFKRSDTSIRFSVFGQTTNTLTTLQKSLYDKLSTTLKKYYDVVTFVGNSKEDLTKTFNKPSLSTNFGFKAFEQSGSCFIQLDTTKGGLRLTSPYEWQWFLSQLDSVQSNNVFIFLAGAPSSFKDNKEGTLFRDVLTDFKQKTHKNVWVFYNGVKNSSTMEKGIKYISTAGFNVDGLTAKNTSVVKYMVVTVKNNVITYELKSIF